MRATVFLLMLSLLPVATAQQTEEEGPRYVIDSVEVVGNKKTATDLILATLLLGPGDLFSERLAERSKVRLLGTGLFMDVSMRLKKGSERGHVIWVIEVSERNTLLISDIYVTTSPEVPALAGFGLAEQNFLGRGLVAEGAFVVGVDIQGDPEIGVRIRTESAPIGEPSYIGYAGGLFISASEFFGGAPGREVLIDKVEEPQPFALLRYQRRGGEAGVGRDVGDVSRLILGLRVEQVLADIPKAASGPIGETPDQRVDFSLENGASSLIAISSLLIRDTRDEPFLPSQGSRLFLQGVLGAQVLGGSYNYGRFEVGAARWQKTERGNVFKTEAYGGLILGDAPFFERFYIGDLSDVVPDRQLDIAPTARGSFDLFGTGISRERYSDVALRMGAEYAVPLRKGEDGVYIYGIQAYVGGGLFSMATKQELLIKDDSRPFGIPFDLTVDAGLRVDTVVGVFGLSFSNAIGIVP